MDADKILLTEEELVFRQETQEVIDRMLYIPGFREELKEFIRNRPIPESIKMKHSPLNFTNKQHE